MNRLIPLRLSERDQALLRGDEGPGPAMAMNILSRMAPVFGASELLDISAAHIDSSVYMGPATLAFAERLADLGAKVAVPSTLNVSGVDAHGWKSWPVPEEWALGSRRQMDAYERMGCIPTWTCAPYQTEHRPRFGQQIASGESNAIAFFNSVIGARTERYPDLLDICCAITGRAPLSGLHTEEGRFGDVVLQISGVPARIQQDDAFYPVLGHLMGKLAADQKPVLNGLEATPTEDQLKALGAGGASSGAVAMFHIVGVTPEAPSLEKALGGKAPEETHHIGMEEVLRARDELSTFSEGGLDTVLLGSPHFSVPEFQKLDTLIRGRHCHPEVTVIVTCSRAIRLVIERMGLIEGLRSFGVKLTVDTCPLVSPMLPDGQRIMTNSAKYAYYSPGLLGATVAYGRLEDCIRSAEAGTVLLDADFWRP